MLIFCVVYNVCDFMKKIILYSTVGCHLCELAKEQLYPILEKYSFSLSEIDIADHPNSEQLMQKYGVRIPVVQVGSDNHKLLSDGDIGWPFDTAMVVEWLKQEGLVDQ